MINKGRLEDLNKRKEHTHIALDENAFILDLGSTQIGLIDFMMLRELYNIENEYKIWRLKYIESGCRIERLNILVGK